MVEKTNKLLTVLKPYCIVTGIVMFVQSLSYIVFCILGIVAYYEGCKDAVLDKTIGDAVIFAYFADRSCINDKYLSTWNEWQKNRSLQSYGLFVWLTVTLSLTLLWLIGSLLLMREINLNNKSKTFGCLLYCSLITALVSMNDIFLGFTFIMETAELHKDTVLPHTSKMQLQIANGIMMAMSFKGFVLWIYNIVSAFYLAYCADIIHKHNKEVVNENRFAQPYNAYESTTEMNTRHWLSDVESLNIPRLNARYVQGENNHAYSNFMDNSKYQQQQPLASIMKKSVVARQEDRMKPTNMKEQHNITSHNGNLLPSNSSGRTQRPVMYNYYNNPNIK